MRPSPARFAPPALHVEKRGAVAARARFQHADEQVRMGVKRPVCVAGLGAACAHGALVDVDHLVELLDAVSSSCSTASADEP
jgi:hypothetical protein